MSRPQLEVPIPALALRRAEAAASLGISVEVFDSKVRPFVPVKRLGGVAVYPTSGLRQFLDSATSVAGDLADRRAS
jgi:hypothetical protein